MLPAMTPFILRMLFLSVLLVMPAWAADDSSSPLTMGLGAGLIVMGGAVTEGFRYLRTIYQDKRDGESRGAAPRGAHDMLNEVFEDHAKGMRQIGDVHKIVTAQHKDGRYVIYPSQTLEEALGHSVDAQRTLAAAVRELVTEIQNSREQQAREQGKR